jgi:predicted RNA-binding Zn-ribbon protein involved in translation (DUF1610 family)
MTSPGAQLAALRKQAVKVCPECGTEFTARLTAVTCSRKCRQKRAYRKQKPAEAG